MIEYRIEGAVVYESVRWPNGVLRVERRYEKGKLQDAPDGMAAWREWYDNFQPLKEKHYIGNNLQDAPDGTAAYRTWYESGFPAREDHYHLDQLQDTLDGIPASRTWHDNGLLSFEARYACGEYMGWKRWNEDGHEVACSTDDVFVLPSDKPGKPTLQKEVEMERLSVEERLETAESGPFSHEPDLRDDPPLFNLKESPRFGPFPHEPDLSDDPPLFRLKPSVLSDAPDPRARD